MTDRELDALVAEKLFDWTWETIEANGLKKVRILRSPQTVSGKHQKLFFPWEDLGGSDARHAWHEGREPLVGFDPGLPHYTTDPAADYAVLERVRETWPYHLRTLFSKNLPRLWYSRCPHSVLDKWGIADMNYRPGDYSLTALAVLGVLPEQPK